MTAPDETPPAAAAPRRIRRPYPGLRPFLDDEESLLFGRERQVREVIERLRETQFVAVIGGSGSGKSSLILAGVVPELRSFGIPGAGDFWVPLVCTPGTNATLEDQQQRLNTPITRLARKFAALLRPCDTPAAAAERLQDIATRLRGERGFARLVRAYSAELAAPPGPNPEDARFLFVIDQFEELFHPTTRRSDDSRLLIERVIDHFFSPHERCYVVLTMRSEHLNDCAGYLELPDAINKASYLVRRLDAEQLRTAITGPAERLLRLRQRTDEDNERLPDAVDFDPAVVDRLLADTRLLDANPDHLPLLQHVLARLWDAAVRRVSGRLDLPELILAEDLAAAVAARPEGPAPALPDGVNVLSACLENWAEAAYQSHDAARRERLDRLLRRLGVKDPNTGMYSQERIDVDEAARLLSLPGGRSAFEALLRQGFIGEMDYLYWDDADHEHVTVKVSHESFIRGWKRLQAAIDDEAERFVVFVETLRKTRKWHDDGRSSVELLEPGDLRRIEEARLQPVLDDAAERARWFRSLEASHSFVMLGAANHWVDALLEHSRQRQHERQNSARWQRMRKRAGWVLLLLALPFVGYWTLVQGPVIQRTALMFRASTLNNSTPLPQSQGEVGSEAQALGSLLRAVDLLEQGRQGNELRSQINRRIVDGLAQLPLVSTKALLVNQVMTGIEPTINGSLRDQLQKWVWVGDQQAPDDEASRIVTASWKVLPCTVRFSLAAAAAGAQGRPAPAGTMTSEDRAAFERESKQRFDVVVSKRVEGMVLTAFNPAAQGASRMTASRGIFMPKPDERDPNIEVRSANTEAATGCESSSLVLAIPRSLNPQIAFDANLRNLLYVIEEGGRLTATVVEIDWEQARGRDEYTIKKLPPTVLTGERAAQALSEAIARHRRGPEAYQPALLETRRASGGRYFMVGQERWFVVDEEAQRVPLTPASPNAPAAMAAAAAASAAANRGSAAGLPLHRLNGPLRDARHDCSRLAAALKDRLGGSATEVQTQTYEDPQDDRYCYVVSFEKPEPAAPASSPAGSRGGAPLYGFFAAVYPRPTATQLEALRPDGDAPGGERAEPLPAAIATMRRFGRSALPDKAQWWVGEAGSPYAGWLAALSADSLGEWRFIAAPWSTCALWRMGRQIYLRQPGVRADANAVGDPATTCAAS